jgi:hypothetical protein
MRTEGIGNLKISKNPTGNWTRNLPSCGSMPQLNERSSRTFYTHTMSLCVHWRWKYQFLYEDQVSSYALKSDSVPEILCGHERYTAILRKAAFLPDHGTGSSCKAVTTFQTFVSWRWRYLSSGYLFKPYETNLPWIWTQQVEQNIDNYLWDDLCFHPEDGSRNFVIVAS